MTNRAMLSVINAMLSVNLHTFCTLDFFFQFVCFVFLLFFYFLVFVLLGVFSVSSALFLSFLFIWALAVVFFAFVEFCLLLTSASTSMLTSMVALASFDEQFHWIYVQYLFLSWVFNFKASMICCSRRCWGDFTVDFLLIPPRYFTLPRLLSPLVFLLLFCCCCCSIYCDFFATMNWVFVVDNSVFKVLITNHSR